MLTYKRRVKVSSSDASPDSLLLKMIGRWKMASLLSKYTPYVLTIFLQEVKAVSLRHGRWYRSNLILSLGGNGVKTRSYRIGHIPPTVIRLMVIGALISPVFGSTDFNQCMKDVQNGRWGPNGGTDSYGNPVADISQATGITYELCIRACGSGSEAFDWPSFSQQFTAWLLPWLALVSQLPFGARLRHENGMSIALAMGSPTLAAYSIVLTVLNTHWLHERFRDVRHDYPNRDFAIRILNNLQQAPLQIVTNDALLASLVVLPENDPWWRDLANELDYAHTWSLATAASIAWVITAYVFTVIGAFESKSFTDVQARIGLDGQAVGSAFLWLLPVVIGWQYISPKSNYKRIRNALERANANAYVASEDGHPVKPPPEAEARAFSLAQYTQGSATHDRECSPPIFNYARFLPWVQAVEDVHSAFYYASRNAPARPIGNVNEPGLVGNGAGVNTPANPVYAAERAEEYCRPPDYVRRSRWAPNVFSRFCVASLLALSLQWGTAGAAAIFAYFTPTRGLSCRSGSYFVYALVSTFVWMLLVASSALAHYSSAPPQRRNVPSIIAKWLRRIDKILAACNAIWIIAVCILQFGNFFKRCYCSSSVLGLGSRAFAEFVFTSDDTSKLWSAWRGAAVLGPAICFIFLAFIYFYINPQLPR